MTLEKTIEYMLENWTALYTKRWECLNQLYCVIGNGYEWRNGEIVSSSGYPEVQEEERLKNKLIYTILESHTQKKSYSFYPLYNGASLLLTVPDDAKKEWIIGAIETIDLILEHCHEDHRVYCQITKEDLLLYKQSLEKRIA